MQEKSVSVLNAREWVVVVFSLAIALHTPSLILFWFEPSFCSISGIAEFFRFSPKDYFRYVSLQLDLIVVFVIVLLTTAAYKTRRKLAICLVAYTIFAGVIYCIRCLGGLRPLWDFPGWR